MSQFSFLGVANIPDQCVPPVLRNMSDPQSRACLVAVYAPQSHAWHKVLPLSSTGVIGLHLDNVAIRIAAGLGLGPSFVCLTSTDQLRTQMERGNAFSSCSYQ